MEQGTAGESATTLLWIRLGLLCGFFTCLAYPLAVFAPLPHGVALVLAALLGPALGIACMGLARLLDLAGPHVGSRLGAVLNTVAGALLTAMMLVQIAARRHVPPPEVPPGTVAVWLGLDVAWDVYIGLGTLAFAWAMARHPRFGAGFALPGALIALGLLALNLATFPAPPADAGLVDLGPLVGLWYLAVTVRIAQSLGWARGRLAA
jgi:hypothetical protein